jgi:hypothetical protein
LDKRTGRIIGCAHQVSHTLGTGCDEKVYENAHAQPPKKDGQRAAQNPDPPPTPVSFLEIAGVLIVHPSILVDLR